MFNSIPMSSEGYARLQKEVERLENEEMPRVLERLAIARAEGDLRENAEYHDAREAQSFLKGKIDDLKSRIARAQIIDPSTMPKDEIRFGATFVVKRLSDQAVLKYTLVGEGDENTAEGKILCTCPLARGFLGKKVGEVAKVKVPKGIMDYEVQSIVYEY